MTATSSSAERRDPLADGRLGPGCVVAWMRAGRAEYGTVEAVAGDMVWVRRVGVRRFTRAHRLPKSAIEVVLVATADQLAQWLAARAATAWDPPTG